MLSVIESISKELEHAKKWYNRLYDESGMFRLLSFFCCVFLGIITIAFVGGSIQYLYTCALYNAFLYGLKYTFFMCAIMTTGFLLCIPAGALLTWSLQDHIEEDDNEEEL